MLDDIFTTLNYLLEEGPFSLLVNSYFKFFTKILNADLHKNKNFEYFPLSLSSWYFEIDPFNNFLTCDKKIFKMSI